MAFNFFGFKKKQDIEDVAVKVPTPPVPSPMSGEKESEPPEQFAETSIQEKISIDENYPKDKHFYKCILQTRTWII